MPTCAHQCDKHELHSRALTLCPGVSPTLSVSVCFESPFVVWICLCRWRPLPGLILPFSDGRTCAPRAPKSGDEPMHSDSSVKHEKWLLAVLGAAGHPQPAHVFWKVCISACIHTNTQVPTQTRWVKTIICGKFLILLSEMFPGCFLELDYTGKTDVEKVKGKMRRLLRKLRLQAVASLFFPTEYFSRWRIHQCTNMPDGLTLPSSLHAWPFTFPLLVSFGPCKNSNWKCKIDGRNKFSLTDSNQSV